MALTNEEIQEMQELENLEKQGVIGPSAGGLTDLEKLELSQLEEANSAGEFEDIKNNPIGYKEADLGTWNRTRYSIEPLDTNRKALLVQEFGKENVAEKDGETYIRQKNEWRPVNAEGLSTADFADMAGAAPEVLGAGAGAALGLGAGSIPFSIAGAGAGSVVRQGVSALLGTPQEATPIERGAEVLLSGTMGGLGTGLVKGGRFALKKAVKNARKMFPKLEIDIDGKELMRIAKEQKLPEPTVGQLAGGKHLDVEKALGERRFWGRKIRQQTQDQVEAIKNNLTDEVGDFVEVTSDRANAGFKLKSYARQRIDKTKQVAGELFDKTADIGRDVTLPRKDFQVSLLDNFNKLGLFDMDGKPMKHSFETGLTTEQFKRVQDIFGKLLEGTKQGASGADSLGVDVIDVNTINTMRKFLDGNIKEGSLQGVDNLLLIKLRSKLMDTAEDMLSKKSDYHKSQFQIARALWSDYVKQTKQFAKGGTKGLGIEDLSDERVLERVFSDVNKVKMMKDMSHPKYVQEAGVEYINDLFTKKLGGRGQASSQGIITSMKKNREAIVEAIGSKKYKTIMDNLFYLNKIGKPINPSRTAIVKMMDLSPSNLLAGGMERLNYAAKEALIPMEEFVKKGAKDNKAITARGLSLLTDEYQREKAVKTRGPNAPKIPYRRY